MISSDGFLKCIERKWVRLNTHTYIHTYVFDNTLYYVVEKCLSHSLDSDVKIIQQSIT